MENITTRGEKWSFLFNDGDVQYRATAQRMWQDEEPFFYVGYSWENNPEPRAEFWGFFLPRGKEIQNRTNIEWICNTPGIKAKFIPLIGAAIHAKLKENNYSIF
jgi:hypothetical protein